MSAQVAKGEPLKTHRPDLEEFRDRDDNDNYILRFAF
jgi:hypothetical protein